MTKEERFAKMKQFYLKTYPLTKSFYEQFGKQKRCLNDEMDSDTENEKVKTEKIEDTPKEYKLDYYENMSTFENVLDLIPMSPVSTPQKSEKEKEEELVNKMFEDFQKTRSWA